MALHGSFGSGSSDSRGSKGNSGLKRSKQQSHWFLIIGLGCFVSAFSMAQRTAAPATHIQSRVTDCEWKAANQYDDGSCTISELARQVMGVCSGERTNAELAFDLLNDPQIDSMEFEQAVNTLENARASRSRPKNSN
jgi:hypothetical protein